jgi:hypothetical protein
MPGWCPCPCVCAVCVHPDLTNKVFVHRFSSLASTAAASRLVAVLDALQTYNDYTADFFVTVTSLSFPAGTAQLAFQYCTRGTPALSPYVLPRLLVPVAVGAPGFVQVPPASCPLARRRAVWVCWV